MTADLAERIKEMIMVKMPVLVLQVSEKGHEDEIKGKDPGQISSFTPNINWSDEITLQGGSHI